MAVRGLVLGMALVATGAPAIASVPHAALPSAPVAAFTELSTRTGIAKILYYKNEDVVKTTSTTTKTPIYTSVVTPVYTTVKTPIVNSAGKITGYTSKQVQTGTTTTQKLTGYNSVTTKATAITPKAELYTTNGSSTAKSAPMVSFSLDVPNGAFTAISGVPQNAFFSFSAVSTSAPILSNGLFSQTFDSGTLSFTRTTPLYKLDKLGHATGPALSNLLTVTFQNAIFTASQNGFTMGFAASTPNSVINFSSDFRQFTKADWLTNFDFALAGNAASTGMKQASVDPTLTNVTGSRTLNSFRVSTTGTFAASAVPEPASWSLMLLGFGVIGFAHRSNRGKLARITA